MVALYPDRDESTIPLSFAVGAEASQPGCVEIQRWGNGPISPCCRFIDEGLRSILVVNIIEREGVGVGNGSAVVSGFRIVRGSRTDPVRERG